MNTSVSPVDCDLVTQFKAGNLEAGNQLIVHVRPKLYGLCAKYGVFGDPAEEAIQETHVRALISIDRINNDEHYLRWCYTTLSNLLKSSSKQFTTQEKTTLDPLMLCIKAEINEAVGAAVAALPELNRRIVRLYNDDGMTFLEIADEVKCSFAAVKSRYYRALQRLREELKKFDSNEKEISVRHPNNVI